MATATTTIKQSLRYEEHHATWFAATQALFNQVAAFYFEVIQAHEGILDFSSKEALTALEKLTHATQRNPHPVMPLAAIVEDMPAMFRRAAIHAALGSARTFFAHRKAWQTRRAKAQAKGKRFTERPPVPPRTWNKSATLYAGMWKDRTSNSLVLKVWTGTCWSWLKCRLLRRELPPATKAGSPQLVRKGKQWWLHTPVERSFPGPPKIAQQITLNPGTKICAVDLNLDRHLAVCSVQTVEGTILATRFISGGQEITGFRKKLLGRIARNRSQTGIIAEDERDNQALWRKISNADENLSHQVSARIVQFAKEHGATILVFEHLGKLKRCHALVIRYAQGQPVEGYTPGAPLVLCPDCAMRSHADRNASLVIGQRLVARYQHSNQEKPRTPLQAERASKDAGVDLSQDAINGSCGPSILCEGHGEHNALGTAQERPDVDGRPLSDMPPTLRPSVSRSQSASAQRTDYGSVSEVAGL